MRIAVFTDTFLPEVNGAVTAIDEHTRALAARGHEVLIICPKYRKPFTRSVPGVRIKRYEAFSFITNKETRIALPLMTQVARDLRRFKPDVVHIHTPVSVGIIGLATARMMRLPIVQTYHTYIPDFLQYVEPHRLLRLDTLQDRILNSLIFERMFSAGVFHRLADLEANETGAVGEIDRVAQAALGGSEFGGPGELTTRFAWQFTRTVYNRGRLVITPSITLKEALEANGVTAPVEYLSNGIDTSIITPKASYAPTGRLLHAGRLGHEKNVDVVVRAFAELLGRYPDYTLDIVGDGPAREGLERLAEKLGIGDRVRMRGFMDRHALGSIYAEYDAFLTASTIETQGIVLLEAMAAGLPIVGVRALAVPELVLDGRDGLIVEPDDVPAFAAAVGRLLDDEQLRMRMGVAGREDVGQHLLPAVVDRLEQLYASVVTEAAAARTADPA